MRERSHDRQARAHQHHGPGPRPPSQPGGRGLLPFSGVPHRYLWVGSANRSECRGIVTDRFVVPLTVAGLDYLVNSLCPSWPQHTHGDGPQWHPAVRGLGLRRPAVRRHHPLRGGSRVDASGNHDGRRRQRRPRHHHDPRAGEGTAGGSGGPLATLCQRRRGGALGREAPPVHARAAGQPGRRQRDGRRPTPRSGPLGGETRQVFGARGGSAVLDAGATVSLDGQVRWAEESRNRW